MGWVMNKGIKAEVTVSINPKNKEAKTGESFEKGGKVKWSDKHSGKTKKIGTVKYGEKAKVKSPGLKRKDIAKLQKAKPLSKKKASYKKTKQERKMEVIKAKESPWEKGKMKKSKK